MAASPQQTRSPTPARLAPVRACVRLRPLTLQEAALGVESAFAVSKTKKSLMLKKQALEMEGKMTWLASEEYEFDAVFGPEVE